MLENFEHVNNRFIFEEAVGRDVAKLGTDINEWMKFLKRGIQMQREAYERDYAIDRYNYTVAVLDRVGMPPDMYKELTEAHDSALEEIKMNLRTKPERKPRIPKHGKYELVDVRKEDSYIYVTVRIKDKIAE